MIPLLFIQCRKGSSENLLQSFTDLTVVDLPITLKGLNYPYYGRRHRAFLNLIIVKLAALIYGIDFLK